MPALTTGHVVAVELYRNDVLVIREGTSPGTQGTTRGEVKVFSRKSRQRLAFVASNTEIDFTIMITLTYPGEWKNDGKEVKRDLRAFLDWLRRETGSCEYLWFLEFQQRGAPHFHILTDALWPMTRLGERGLRFRVSSTWYRIVGSGDRRHLAAGCRTEKLRSSRGGARYAVKYAMKMRQKLVPPDYRNAGRFWGCSGKVRPLPGERIQVCEDDVRGVLEGWKYAPAENGLLCKVLYNQAERFAEHVK